MRQQLLQHYRSFSEDFLKEASIPSPTSTSFIFCLRKKHAMEFEAGCAILSCGWCVSKYSVSDTLFLAPCRFDSESRNVWEVASLSMAKDLSLVSVRWALEGTRRRCCCLRACTCQFACLPACLPVCMYVYMYVYVYVYAYVYVNVYVCVCMYVCVYTYIYIYMCVCVRALTCCSASVLYNILHNYISCDRFKPYLTRSTRCAGVGS